MFVLILSHVLLYAIMHCSVFSFTKKLSIFFLRDFPVVRISPDGLQAHSRVNPVVRMLPVISGRACFRMTFPSIANAAIILQWLSHHCLVCGNRVYHKKVWTTTHILWTIKNTDQKQKKPGETTEETSGCVRLEWVNKWPISMIAKWWWWWWWWCIVWSHCKYSTLPMNQTGSMTDLNKMCSVWSILDVPRCQKPSFFNRHYFWISVMRNDLSYIP